MSGPTMEKARLGIPDRWLCCPRMGQIVEDLFLPFKTPLCSLYDSEVDREHRFQPEDVFNAAAEKGKKIGLWCDFTKTDRFYFVSEIESKGCIYKKIKMEGHGGAPTAEQVDEFILAVRKFAESRQGNEIVAVHCTHGFNRTGFAIASYLVKVFDMAVEYAVQLFAAQRPCGIYKQEYINELFRRFGDMEDCLEAPDKPSWELGDDVSADLMTTASTSGKSSANSNPSGKLFMDGKVENVFYVSDNSKKAMLRGIIQELCHYKRDGFPGLQPVSLKRDNIQLLAKRSYKVSWKADGMRYMVYITEEGEVYAFDRDNEVFQIEGLDFPHRKKGRSIANTLVDAEMIIDKVKDDADGTERDIPRLLIYDIIHFEEFNISKMDFNKRMECIDFEIIRARSEAMAKGTIKNQSMSVRKKAFWDIDMVPKLLAEKFRQSLPHEIDGLIFQPVNMPYMAGRCDEVLKWKPPSHNSIDFLMRIRKEERPGLLPEYNAYLYVQHQNEPFGKMKATKTLKPYDNKIIECTFDMNTGQWIFMRERTDKSLPNSINTAHSVYESIVQPITDENLISFVMKYCLKRRPSGATGPNPQEVEAKKPRIEQDAAEQGGSHSGGDDEPSPS